MSFASKNVDKGSNFEPIFAFYGDAKLVSGGMSLQLSGSSVSSAGRVVYKYPIKLVKGNPTKLVSFETNFGFSLTSEEGDGLAFVMVPIGYPVNAFNGGSFGLLAEPIGRLKKAQFLFLERVSDRVTIGSVPKVCSFELVLKLAERKCIFLCKELTFDELAMKCFVFFLDNIEVAVAAILSSLSLRL